jgi:hypothetical protein
MGLRPKAREMGILTSNHGIAMLSSTSLLSFLAKILNEWSQPESTPRIAKVPTVNSLF